MNSEIAYTVSDSCTFEELLLFFKQVESDFNPPLFQRIDVNAFVLKVLKYATINTCRLDNKLKGMIIFYANDLLKKEAHITFLAVDCSHRGLHIAFHLVQSASEEAKSKGMTKICVSTCNPNVVRFYHNNGFLKFKEDFDSDAGTIRFYLEKGL